MFCNKQKKFRYRITGFSVECKIIHFWLKQSLWYHLKRKKLQNNCKKYVLNSLMKLQKLNVGVHIFHSSFFCKKLQIFDTYNDLLTWVCFESQPALLPLPPAEPRVWIKGSVSMASAVTVRRITSEQSVKFLSVSVRQEHNYI